MTRKTLLTIILLLACLCARAQFVTHGDNPGHLKWFSIETPHYQLIYPAGSDSLARTYGRLLEQFRVPVGRSFGIVTGEGQRHKMPVVLHAFYPYSNGSVGWAPSRYDLYTIPPAYNTEPTPWNIQLSAHEPRHQAQLEATGKGWFKTFNILTGQIWNPVAWQVYYGWALGEGDAVVAETGLWHGTRARTADFLNYYRIAFDQGDFRNWDRWRYGSYKHFTPDHYALGYLTLAGSRYLTGNPMLMQETARLSRRHPFQFSHAFRSQLKKNNGGKSFKEYFREIQDTLNAHWQADAAARAPFMEITQITPLEKYPVGYDNLEEGDGMLYSIQGGFTKSPHLVRINPETGEIKVLMTFTGSETNLSFDSVRKRLYFGDTRLHPRWKLAGSSAVMYYDIATGKCRDLVKGKFYFNPLPSENGEMVAVSEYFPSGETAVTLISADDGKEIRRTMFPDGLQPTELAWMGDTLYVSAISAPGYGIYRILPSGELEQVLAPSIQKLQNMGADENYVQWTSDRTGVNEAYRYYPEDGRLVQITSTRYGITDPIFIGNWLYTLSTTLEGVHVFRTPIEDTIEREVDFADVHSYFLADNLAAQEQALGPGPDLEEAVPLSAPKRYYKLAHPLRLHSWLPLYVNYDAIREGSMDFTYETASIGFTGFFQNTLGTLFGTVGYSLHPNPDVAGTWRNSLHAKLTYSGLYPVFEASLDFGHRAARQYYVNDYLNNGVSRLGLGAALREAPLFTASIKAYVPLSYHKHGVNYGFIPQVSYSISNNMLATDPVLWVAPERFEGLPAYYKLINAGTDDENIVMQRLSVSARGYVMLSKAENHVYPGWGVGAELGASLRPGLQSVFSPNLYAYLYGYTPGFTSTQGLRLSALVQRQVSSAGLYIGELAVNTLPRGFEGEAGSFIGQNFPFQWKVTADYAIPIYVGDLYIPGLAFIKNFVLTPHGDFAGMGKYNLWSAGADFAVELSRLILPFDASVGVSFSWLGGSLYKYTDQEKPWSVGLIFDMDF